jgi:hypothetical protein
VELHQRVDREYSGGGVMEKKRCLDVRALVIGCLVFVAGISGSYAYGFYAGKVEMGVSNGWVGDYLTAPYVNATTGLYSEGSVYLGSTADTRLYRSGTDTISLGAGDSLIGAHWMNSTHASTSDLYVNNDVYLQGTNRTDVLAYPEQTASYIIWVDGGIYYAKNGHTGAVTSNTDAAMLINTCINALPARGGEIILSPQEFSVTSIILIDTKYGITIKGSGNGPQGGDPPTNLKNTGGQTSVIKIHDSQYCKIKDLGITGDYTPNHYGLLIDGSIHGTYENLLIKRNDRNIDLIGIGGDQSFKNVHAGGTNYFLTYGIHIDGTGLYMLQLDHCILGRSYFKSSPSLEIRNCVFESYSQVGTTLLYIYGSGGTIQDCQIELYTNANAVERGLEMVACTNLNVIGNSFYVDAAYTGGDLSMALFDTCTGGSFIGNKLIGNNQVGVIGLHLAASPTITWSSNNNLSGSLGNVFTTCPTSVLGNYVTENGSTFSIALHATTATITHGLSYTPAATDITITWTTVGGLLNCTSWSVTGIGAATFTVNLYDANGAAKGPSGTVTGSWAARRTP